MGDMKEGESRLQPKIVADPRKEMVMPKKPVATDYRSPPKEKVKWRSPGGRSVGLEKTRSKDKRVSLKDLA